MTKQSWKKWTSPLHKLALFCVCISRRNSINDYQSIWFIINFNLDSNYKFFFPCCHINNSNPSVEVVTYTWNSCFVGHTYKYSVKFCEDVAAVKEKEKLSNWVSVHIHKDYNCMGVIKTKHSYLNERTSSEATVSIIERSSNSSSSSTIKQQQQQNRTNLIYGIGKRSRNKKNVRLGFELKRRL